LTAPGRSAEDIPIKRESREPKPAAAYRLPLVGDDIAAPGGEMSMIRPGIGTHPEIFVTTHWHSAWQGAEC